MTALTESDVRRIVRDEIRHEFERSFGTSTKDSVAILSEIVLGLENCDNGPELANSLDDNTERPVNVGDVLAGAHVTGLVRSGESTESCGHDFQCGNCLAGHGSPLVEPLTVEGGTR